MKKEDLAKLVIPNLTIWVILIIILKWLRPQFVHLSGIIKAIFAPDVVVIVYICVLIPFALLTYISFLLGLKVVYDESIGRFIRFIKTKMGKFDVESNYFYERENCNLTDTLLLATYTFIVLPLLLYFILPALLTILLGIFILYCIFQ